jgi:hypothetical protein
MIRLLLKIWPAFLPVAVFLVWYFISKRRYEAGVYDVFLEKKRKYFFYTMIATLILTIATLLYSGFSQPATQRIDTMEDNVR